MHGPRKYRRGSGGGGPGPSATNFFSHQLNSGVILKKTIIFQISREGPTFSGGGQTLPGGGGQSIRKNSISHENNLNGSHHSIPRVHLYLKYIAYLQKHNCVKCCCKSKHYLLHV